MVYSINGTVIDMTGELVEIHTIGKIIKEVEGMILMKVADSNIKTCYCRDILADKATLVDVVNAVKGKKLTTEKEALDLLTDIFIENCKYIDDKQEAFDEMIDEFNDFLDFPLVYATTNGWSIKVKENADMNAVYKYLFGNNHFTIEDAESRVEKMVYDTMCNAGCDAWNALAMEEDNGLPEAFYIDSNSDEIRIELLV